jgi:hypothetical protein
MYTRTHLVSHSIYKFPVNDVDDDYDENDVEN